MYRHGYCIPKLFPSPRCLFDCPLLIPDVLPGPPPWSLRHTTRLALIVALVAPCMVRRGVDPLSLPSSLYAPQGLPGPGAEPGPGWDSVNAEGTNAAEVGFSHVGVPPLRELSLRSLGLLLCCPRSWPAIPAHHTFMEGLPFQGPFAAARWLLSGRCSQQRGSRSGAFSPGAQAQTRPLDLTFPLCSSVRSFTHHLIHASASR